MSVIVPTQLPGVDQLLFRLIGANMNVTTDQALVPYLWTPGQNYLIKRIRVVNASLSLTLAAGGIYTAASKAGNAIVAAAQAYSALTGATIGLDATIAAVGNGLQTVTPILSLTTAQGAAATADFYVFGALIGNL
jgi:hypothetical protein